MIKAIDAASRELIYFPRRRWIPYPSPDTNSWPFGIPLPRLRNGPVPYMHLRMRHFLDYLLPQHSDYSFRNASVQREQSRTPFITAALGSSAAPAWSLTGPSTSSGGATRVCPSPLGSGFCRSGSPTLACLIRGALEARTRTTAGFGITALPCGPC